MNCIAAAPATTAGGKHDGETHERSRAFAHHCLPGLVATSRDAFDSGLSEPAAELRATTVSA